MVRKLLFGIIFVTLLLSIGVMGAQDASPSLRELAAERGIYVGAAAYTRHLNDPVHADLMAREFNMLTPEQEGKHCELERQLGQFNFTRLDELVAFAEENDMVVHGHTLVWHQCTPQWVANGDFTREEAIELLRASIMTIVGRYKGRIAIWDVVNEGVNDNGVGLRDTPWYRLIGEDYIELAFQFAHEADPDALLFYNDYGAEEMNAKSDAIYAMVQDFVERGVPIHGVGLQAHLISRRINVGFIAENIQRLGELGLQVQFTEIDIRHDGEPTDTILEQQANDYRRVMDVCLNSEYCTAFIVWGVADRYTWLRGPNLGFFQNPAVAPLLFDDDYEPKPAYFAVQSVLSGGAAVVGEADTAQGEAVAAVEIPEPTKTDSQQLAPDSVPGVVYYAPYSVSITLDGATDDWANVPRATVDHQYMMPDEGQSSLTYAAAADETHLYFLAEVQDPNPAYGTRDPASEWYEEDSVEFYINATGDLDASAYQPGIAQIGILAANITNPDTPLIGGSNSDTSGVDVVVVETEDGYIVEASVPLVTDVWSIEPEHEGVLGFQVHLNGASSPDAGRDAKLIWSVYDTGDQSWTDPGVFGQLIFWDRAQ